jgi:hypothetical protein
LSCFGINLSQVTVANPLAPFSSLACLGRELRSRV